MSKNTSIGKKQQGVDLKDIYCDEPKSGFVAEELLSMARLALVCDFPFFGKVALNLTFVESEQVPTTAVDARGIFYFNRKFVNSFDKKDSLWVMAHEVMHLVQRFFARKPAGANHMLFNLAADYVLETNLLDTGLEQAEVSKKMCTPEVVAMVNRVGGTVPAVYRELLEKVEEQTDCQACKEIIQKLQQQGKQQQQDNQEENKEINKGKGDEGEGQEGSGEGEGEGQDGEDEGEGHEHGSGDTEHTCGHGGSICCSGILADEDGLEPDEQQDWIEKIIAAKIHAEGKGNMPAGLGEAIDTLGRAKVRWQDHVIASVSRLYGQDRYTYKRPSRRGHAMGIRMPGHVPDGKTAITAVDTSASMSEDEVRQCVTEVAAIMKVCGCDKLWLILHDTRTYFSGWVGEADLTNLKMARGGTDHQEVFDCLNREHKNKEFNLPREEEVSLAILFSDLGTCFPEEVPKYDVLWVVPSDGNPGMSMPVPYGKKIIMEMD